MAAEGVPQPRRVRDPSLADAIIPLVTLVVLIAGSLALFGLDALGGPIQVALILCVLTVALIVLKNGRSWDEVGGWRSSASG
jgi:Na+:H+ antiporter, NhaC family